MKKIYSVFLLLLIAFPFASFAKSNKATNSGTIIIHLDGSKYPSININEVYVVFDKYDHTGAGIIKQKVALASNEAVINNVPDGKYFVDVYTAGDYRQHFSMVVEAANKVSKYKLVLDNIVYAPPSLKHKKEIINNATGWDYTLITETAVAKN
jgi:hypothetical protein